MTEFDRTERKYIEQIIDRAVSMPQIGVVEEVTEHTSTSDLSNFEATVKLRDEQQSRRDVPIATSSSGILHVPEVGDMVIVSFLDENGNSEFPVITGTVYTDQDRAPLGEAGIFRVTKGNLYLELEADGSTGRISKKSADDAAPDAKVEIDSGGNITIETDGDITVSAGGDVVIDEGGTATPVAKQNHDHDFSGTDSGGDSFSGTTTTPNQSGTSTQIE